MSFQLDESVIELMQPYVAATLDACSGAAATGSGVRDCPVTFNRSGFRSIPTNLVYPMPRVCKRQEFGIVIIVCSRGSSCRQVKCVRFISDFLRGLGLSQRTLAASSTIAPFVSPSSRKFFLTKFVDTVNPKEVKGDFQFCVSRRRTHHFVRSQFTGQSRMRRCLFCLAALWPLFLAQQCLSSCL